MSVIIKHITLVPFQHILKHHTIDIINFVTHTYSHVINRISKILSLSHPHTHLERDTHKCHILISIKICYYSLPFESFFPLYIINSPPFINSTYFNNSLL